jgi:hypothetical protein
MSRSGAPEGFEIAALKQKQAEVWDPMAHGPGTPWEDRATQGTVVAFFKTAIASMTRPRQLALDLRRPETTRDARGFVIGCGIPWGISAAYHIVWALYHKANHPELLDKKTDLSLDVGDYSGLWLSIDLAVALVGGTIGIVLLWTLFTAIYNHLVQQEARPVKVTEPLVANVAAYAFGPSLLAVLPIVGPPLAAAAVAVVASTILWFASDRFLPSAVPTMDKELNNANQPAIQPSNP